MKYRNQSYKKNGFTLIEVLVSLVLFGVGLLGIALQFSNGISARINNEVHSSVMQISLQEIEPLNNAILLSDDNFQDELKNVGNGEGEKLVFGTNNSDLSAYTIRVNKAKDYEGENLLTSEDTDSWVPPFTVVLEIKYTGNEGGILTYYTTHVFVP